MKRRTKQVLGWGTAASLLFTARATGTLSEKDYGRPKDPHKDIWVADLYFHRNKVPLIGKPKVESSARGLGMKYDLLKGFMNTVGIVCPKLPEEKATLAAGTPNEFSFCLDYSRATLGQTIDPKTQAALSWLIIPAVVPERTGRPALDVTATLRPATPDQCSALNAPLTVFAQHSIKELSSDLPADQKPAYTKQGISYVTQIVYGTEGAPTVCDQAPPSVAALLADGSHAAELNPPTTVLINHGRAS